MKLNKFPLDVFGRNGYVPPAMIVLSLCVLIAVIACSGSFFMTDVVAGDLPLVLASMLVPSKVSEKKNDIEHLEAIAYRDSLTGLRNRRGLQEDVESMQTRGFDVGSRMAVILIDLDRFKFINDTLGHAAGDQILISLADRLSGLCDGDRKCYRLGGDEFLILWSDGPTFLQVDEFCKKIKAIMSDPYKVDRTEVEGGGSLGITWEKEIDRGLGTILKRADMALYKAKAVAGSAHRFFCGQMEEETRLKRNIESELRTLIIEGNFDLKYQPVAHSLDLDVDHFEVVAYKQDDGDKKTIDDAYATLLEESGLVIQFDRAVLERAMSEISLRKKRCTLIVRMNSDQLLDPTFVSYFDELTKANNLSGTRFILIFDTLDKPANQALVDSSLEQLAEIGVRIGSFGLGRDISNFERGKMPASRYLVLGHSWIANIIDDESARESFNNLVRLATCMNMRVIVDDVQTLGQVEYLKSFNGMLIKGPIVDEIDQNSAT